MNYLYISLLLLASATASVAQTITTVAGDGTAGYSGDGSPATNASLNVPGRIVVGSNGDLFITDESNLRIRKVATDGTITTIAGTGTLGFPDDGSLATNANLRIPYGIALDGNGNLFFGDIISHRVHKIDVNGVITTVAGNGFDFFSGDNVLATNTGLTGPGDIAVDGNGNLFIIEGSGRILKVATNGIITTVAGNDSRVFSGDGGLATSAGVESPVGITVDANGNLFIAEETGRVRKVATSGIITTVAGNGTPTFSGDGGPATSAGLRKPYDIAIDIDGNIFIAELFGHRIRKVTASTGIITTVAGTTVQGYSGDGGPATSANLQGPSGIALDGSGNLFIADRVDHRIRRVSAPAPPASVSISPANPVAVCAGSPFSVTALATNFSPTSYAWINLPAGLTATGATPTFTAPFVNEPTAYTLTVTASDGTLSATGSVTMTVNVQPDIFPNPATVALTHNDPITVLSVQSSVPVVWSTSETTPTISVSIAGTYSVTATSSEGCTVSGAAVVTSLQAPVTGPDCGFLMLNGTSGHVQINGLGVVDSGPYDFPVFGSISFLMKPNSFVAGMTLISTGDPASPTNGLRLWYDASGRLNLNIGNSSAATTITSTLPFSTN